MAGTRRVKLEYSARPWQVEMQRGMESKRWSVIVAHRRAGKTVAMVNRLIRAGLMNPRNDGRYAYVGPQLNQAKDIAWGYLKRYAGPLLSKGDVSESELWIKLPNGSRIRIYGADNPQNLRGGYLDGVILDEVAQMKPEIWQEVVSPQLSDYKGWAVFIGTPRGQNLFFDRYNSALKNPEWFVGLYPVDKTGVIPDEEIESLRGRMNEDMFRQEFLCDFTANNPNGVIDFMLVSDAENRKLVERDLVGAPLVFGLDPARFGDDRSALAVRKGLALLQLKTWKDTNLMQLSGYLCDLIDKMNPVSVFIDVGGLGAGVVDRMWQIGHQGRVIAVNSSNKSSNQAKFLNLRAEMWWRMRDWFELGAFLPNDPELRADLLAPTYEYDAANRIKIESKEKMKARGLKSPDLADALALTFAYPVEAYGRVEDPFYGEGVRRYAVPTMKPEYNPLEHWR